MQSIKITVWENAKHKITLLEDNVVSTVICMSNFNRIFFQLLTKYLYLLKLWPLSCQTSLYGSRLGQTLARLSHHRLSKQLKKKRNWNLTCKRLYLDRNFLLSSNLNSKLQMSFQLFEMARVSINLLYSTWHFQVLMVLESWSWCLPEPDSWHVHPWYCLVPRY